MKSYSFPAKYTKALEKALNKLSMGLHQSELLAASIKKLSDLYISRQVPKDIWREPKWVAAYLTYFFPLNYLRYLRVAESIDAVGFYGLYDEVIDVGSGCGTLIWAFLDQNDEKQRHSFVAYDQSPSAAKWLNFLLEECHAKANVKVVHQLPQPRTKSLFTYSYSLNEMMPNHQKLVEQSHLLIVEPSFRNTSRDLMDLRKKLLNSKHYAWAPCTHQLGCPLLEHSKKDWCHDRIQIEMPDWYLAIEEKLPQENRTLTFSYLATSQAKPSHLNAGRIIGDTQKEKGKTRQAIC